MTVAPSLLTEASVGTRAVQAWPAVPPRVPRRRLRVRARAHADVDAAALWALLEDVNRYKDWGPWSESDYVRQPSASPHGAGAIRRLRHRDRHATMIAPVVTAVPERLLVYEVTSGLPAANYRATVHLAPDDSGTDVLWLATFDRTVGARLARRTLRRVYGELVERLVAAAEAPGRSRRL
jgi:hypothetical protein